MKILESKDNLCRHLDIVEKALPGKTTMPMLNYIFLKTYPGQLVFLSTNLEIGVRSVYHTSLEDEIAVLIPPRFIDIIKNLPPGNLKIEINPDNYQIDIKSSHSHFKLNGVNSEEYPAFSESSPTGQPLVLKGENLKRLIKKNIFAVSQDESRPAFTGILLTIKDNKLTLTTSDTYRLVLKEFSIESWDFKDGDFLIPARALRELMKLVDEDMEVSIFPQDNQLAFAFGNVFFFSRLIDDTFPEVKGVIPQQTVTKCLVNNSNLESAINRASLLVDPQTQALQINVSGNELEVKVSSKLGHMEEKVSLISQEGENISIFLNTRFLMDILKVTEEENLEMHFSGLEAPCIIRPEKEEDYLYLVLPIKME